MCCVHVLEIFCSGEFTDRKWLTEELSSTVELRVSNPSMVRLVVARMREEADADSLCLHCSPTSGIVQRQLKFL